MSELEILEKISKGGLEYYGKYYSLYHGIVSDNADPQKQGRIKVRVPALGRDEALNEFAYPVSPFAGVDAGFFFPPEVGDTVWVLFECGNPNLPLYLGGWWGKADLPSALRPKSDVPKVRGIQTKSGHKIIFDDSEEAGIKIETAKGNLIHIDDIKGELLIKIVGFVTVEATKVDVKSPAVNVLSQEVNINGANIRINNGTKFAAAIGDKTAGGASSQTIIGPPTGVRPMIT